MDQDHSSARVLRGRNRIRITETPTGDDARDVRAHIQAVALELFIEEGYDKTSLREIAEKLGVTKAALYYHFPTKEDIVSSLIEERIAAVDALIEWAKQQPDAERMRLEFIRRYAAGLHDVHRHEHIMRFFERNQTVVNTLQVGQHMRNQMVKISDLLADREESLDQQLRRAMAIFSIHAGWFVLRDRGDSEEERRQVTLDLALELMASADARASGDSPASSDARTHDARTSDGPSADATAPDTTA